MLSKMVLNLFLTSKTCDLPTNCCSWSSSPDESEMPQPLWARSWGEFTRATETQSMARARVTSSHRSIKRRMHKLPHEVNEWEPQSNLIVLKVSLDEYCVKSVCTAPPLRRSTSRNSSFEVKLLMRGQVETSPAETILAAEVYSCCWKRTNVSLTLIEITPSMRGMSVSTTWCFNRLHKVCPARAPKELSDDWTPRKMNSKISCTWLRFSKRGG